MVRVDSTLDRRRLVGSAVSHEHLGGSESMLRALKLGVATATLAGTLAVTGASPVFAGCAINVHYVNTADKTATIDLLKSKVRIRISTVPVVVYGTWARIDPNNSQLKIKPNFDKSRVYTLDLGCSKNRQYKFFVNNGTNDSVIYKPSATGVTKSTNLTVTIN
jgi:hypothetical protein